MSKKLIITSALLILALAGLVGYYFISKDNNGEPNNIIEGFKNFFPFGGSDYTGENTNPGENTGNTGGENPETDPNFVQKLRKLSVEPVSGAGTMDIQAGTVVRYIEKATGHIYETELFSPKNGRISNTTIPLAYDAIWGNKNGSLMARYLKDDNQTVDTYSITLKSISTTTENTIAGIPFPGGISDISVSNTNVFYLEQSDSFSTGYVSSFDGKTRKQIWTSPIKELNSQFVNDRTVALNTKPSQNIPGFLYLVDTTTGQVKNSLRNVPGLSTLVNTDATEVLYLQQDSTAILYLFKSTDKSAQGVDFVTFPEKCVWSKKTKEIVYCAVPKEYIGPTSLISWYKGFSSFTDNIWKYNTKDGSSSILLDLSKESGQKIDIVKPVLSENEQYLIFINKIDNSLWSLDLTK